MALQPRLLLREGRGASASLVGRRHGCSGASGDLVLQLLDLGVDVHLRHVLVGEVHPIGHKIKGPPSRRRASREAELLHGALAIGCHVVLAGTLGQQGAGEEGHEDRGRGAIGSEPHRGLRFAASLRDLRVRSSRDRGRACELAREGHHAAATLQAVRRLEGPCQGAQRHVELRALIVRAEEVHHVQVSKLLLHGHGEGVGPGVVGDLNPQARRDAAEDPPLAHRGVHGDGRQECVVAEVLDVRGHDLHEIKGPLAVPQPRLLRELEEARVQHEVVLVLGINHPDDEVVRHDSDVVVRDTRCCPKSTALTAPLARGLARWNAAGDVEDPRLTLGINNLHRLARAALARVLAVEAVLCTQVAHGLHGAPGSLASLQSHSHELADGEHGIATIQNARADEVG
mmetsp:Transcript_89596/g.232272  ORF Transcript_89596/g.232272 Transcript_89596/m.232272 type:complete len:400 (+) Transcript_89596:756-1955(+)